MSLSLIPDYFDNPSACCNDHEILSSFCDQKRNVQQSLYGMNKNDEYESTLLKDNSPKGSIDYKISFLVDLINSHPSFATLSSCSGRISLFDPNCMSYGSSSSRLLTDNFLNENSNISDISNHVHHSDIENESLNDLHGKNIDNFSGKGNGKWLLSSHRMIETYELVEVLEKAKEKYVYNSLGIREEDKFCLKTFIFKHEPIILHVAASNLNRARQLLNIALKVGLRESGIVYTSKRVTVVIRSHSLALTVPLASFSTLWLGYDYVNWLVRQANERFILNEKKLVQLERTITSGLFKSCYGEQCRYSKIKKNENSDVGTLSKYLGNYSSINTVIEELPMLNLWGYSTVFFSKNIIRQPDYLNRSDNNYFLYVFGGHGIGPDFFSSHEGNTKYCLYEFSQNRKNYLDGNSQLCTRQNPTRNSVKSNKIFYIHRYMGKWDYAWREILQSMKPDEESQSNIVMGFSVLPCLFTERESHSSCLLPIYKTFSQQSNYSTWPFMAAIFGGKKKLELGTNELMLFTCESKKAFFYIPLDVRGKLPSPRWGQSFISLSGNNGRAAFLSGGRNRTSVVSDAYTLSYITSRNSRSNLMHFLWEKVNAYVPRFNHCTSLVPNYQKDVDTILIIGGLVKSNDLLQTFSLSSKGDKQHYSKNSNSYSIIDLGNDFSDQKWSTIHHNPASFAASNLLFSSFNNNSFDNNIVHHVIHGGIILSHVKLSIECFSFDKVSGKIPSLFPYSIIINPNKGNEMSGVSFLLHQETSHTPCPLPKPTYDGFVMVGSGVPSFSFGSFYFKSYNFEPSLTGKSYYDQSSQKYIGGKSTWLTKGEKKMHFNNPEVSMTNVLYVRNRNAKELKIILESLNYYEKKFKISKVTSGNPVNRKENIVTLPVTDACINILLYNDKYDLSLKWKHLIIAYGQHYLPYNKFG